MQSYIQQFDQRLLVVSRSLPHSLLPSMQAATFIGYPAVIIALSVLLSLVSWLKGYANIAYASLACLVALGGNTILKHVIHRSRPDTMYVDNMRFHSFSFPSGHAFGSMVFYGLIAYLALQHLPKPWNVIVAVVLAIAIVLVGVSRVYLGAHFPSDVMAGWLLGALSLVIIIKVFHP